MFLKCFYVIYKKDIDKIKDNIIFVKDINICYNL